MRVRRLLSSTSLVGVLTVSGYFSPLVLSDSLAQKSTMMRPVTQWSVSNVKSRGQDAYCAIARRFSRGLILTVAKNRNSESSFAFDFQSKIFSPAQRLSVALDPGAGEMRTYDISAASDSAFVIRLGRDDAFLNALRKTGFLRVEFGRESYHFNLADIDKGEGELESCLAAVTAPAAGSPYAAAPVAETYMPQQEEYNRKLENLQEQISQLQQDNQSQQQSLRGTAQARSVVPAPLQDTRTVLVLNDKIERLEQENEDLRNQLAQLEPYAGAQSELEALKAENEAYEQKLEEKEEAVQLAAALEKEIADLRAKNGRLQMAVNEQGEDGRLADDLRAKLEREQKENERLRRDIKLLEKRFEGLQGYQAELDYLRDQNARLMEAVKAMENRQGGPDTQAALQIMENKIKTMQAQNADLQEKLRQARAEAALGSQEEITRLAAENQMLTGQLAESAEALKAAEELKNRLTALERENAALQEKAAGAGSVEEKEKLIEELRARAEQLEEENRSLRGEIENKTAQAQADYVQQIEELRARNSELERDLENMGNEKSQTEENLRETEALKQENANLEAELEALRSEEAEAMKRIETFGAENARLQKELEKSREETAALAPLREELAALESENESLAKALEEARNDSVAAANDAQALDELRTENEKLKAELQQFVSSARPDNGAPEEAAADPALQERFEALQAVNAELEQALQAANAEIDTLREHPDGEEENAGTVAALRAENEELRGRLEKKDSQYAGLQREMDGLRREHEHNMEQAAIAEKPEQEALIASLREEIETLTRQKEEAERRAEQAAGQGGNGGEELPEELADLKEENSNLRKKLEDAERRADIEKQNAMQELAKQYMALRARQGGNGAAAAQEQAPGPDRSRALPAVQKPEDAEMPEEQVETRLETLETGHGENAVAENPEESGEGDASPPPEAAGMEEGVPSSAGGPVNESMMTEAQKQEQAMAESLRRRREQAEPADAFSESVFTPEVEEFEPEEEISGVYAAEPAVPAAAPVPVEESVLLPMDGELSSRVAAAPVTAAPEKPEGETGGERYRPQVGIGDVLNAAGVRLERPISVVGDVSGPAFAAYQWGAEGVFGSGEQRPLGNDYDFDKLVLDYLERTEARCPAEFAAMPMDTRQLGNARIDSYDIACIGGDVNSAASLVFFSRNGTFTAMAHEAPAEQMEKAMTIRDRLAETVRSSSI